MPPLVLLGHEWHTGSDDLPALLGPLGVVNCVWCDILEANFPDTVIPRMTLYLSTQDCRFKHYPCEV